MAIFTRRSIHDDNVIVPVLDMAPIIEILWASRRLLLYKMEKVLMCKLQTITFRAGRYVGLVPYEVIPENPTALLHLNGKTGWDKQ